MKKISSLILIGSLLGGGLLSSCGNNNPAEVLHTISVSTNENYSINVDRTNAKADETVKVTVEATNVFYDVDYILVNDQKVTSTDGAFTFTMPNGDVTISAVMKDVAEFDDPNDNLTFAKGETFAVSTASASDKDVSWDITDEIYLDYGDVYGKWITQVDAKLEIQNTNVIPKDALKYESITNKQQQSNEIVGGKLVFDLKKISVGETLIYLDLKPNNSSLGKLIKKITVSEYGTIHLETMKAHLEFTNNSSYSDSEIFVSLQDDDFVYGSDNTEYINFDLSTLTGNTYSFDYVIGHKYYIGIGVKGNSSARIKINDWVGNGDSVTGFNKIKNNYLTLLTPDMVAQVTFR